MGRTVYAEEQLLEYLQTLGTQEAYSVGLILGQSSAQKDFIVHLARTLPATETKVVEEPVIKPLETPPQNKIKSNSYIKSIQDIDVKLVADQAKHVTRMLPGGMWVLGIFVAGPRDCLNDTQCVQKLRAVLTAIYKDLTANVHLNGISNQDNIILIYNSNTKQYICKSIETSSGGIFKPADWKFQKKATKWHHLEALVDLDHLFPIPDDTHPQTLKRLLKDILKKVSDMIDSSLIVIEGESGQPDNAIEIICKKFYNKQENDEENIKQILKVGVYLPCAANQEKTVKISSCGASMKLIGQLVSRIALHQKASFKEATDAIKQDILRSLASRLELHWDSVIEEENGSPEENIILHEPPRRVLVELPESGVTLSDYLFPGEKPKESVVLLRELLDLEIQESQVQDFIEQQVDLTRFYNQNEEKSNSIDHSKESSSNSLFLIYVIGGIVAFIVAIIGILVHLIYSRR